MHSLTSQSPELRILHSLVPSGRPLRKHHPPLVFLLETQLLLRCELLKVRRPDLPGSDWVARAAATAAAAADTGAEAVRTDFTEGFASSAKKCSEHDGRYAT